MPTLKDVRLREVPLYKVLSALSQSDYTISSSEEFTKLFKLKSIPDNYKLVSLDIKLLFTNVPLDSSIDIILNGIFDKKELTKDVESKNIRDLILLLIKNVHFTFNKNIFKQTDGAAMDSPLGPVLVGIIMVEIENTMVLGLRNHLYF